MPAGIAICVLLLCFAGGCGEQGAVNDQAEPPMSTEVENASQSRSESQAVAEGQSGARSGNKASRRADGDATRPQSNQSKSNQLAPSTGATSDSNEPRAQATEGMKSTTPADVGNSPSDPYPAEPIEGQAKSPAGGDPNRP